MQFEFNIESSASDVIIYCYNRLLDFWPHAVMCDPANEGRMYRRPVTTPCTVGPVVQVFQDEDGRLTSQLFPSGAKHVPSVIIEVLDKVVTIAPSETAADLSSKLASLPIWAHKTRESNRTPAV